MSAENYNIYSYLSATCAYFVLLLLSLWGIKRYTSGVVFFIAVLVSLVWSAYTSYNLYNDELFTSSILPFETLRNLAWFIYLLAMLSNLEQNYSLEQSKNSEKFNYTRIKFLTRSKYIIALIVATLLVF